MIVSGSLLCLAGDRTGSDTEEFFINHTTTDGVRFIAAGLKKELTPELRTVVALEHDLNAGTLTPVFQHLSDLPTIQEELPRSTGIEIRNDEILVGWDKLFPDAWYFHGVVRHP